MNFLSKILLPEYLLIVFAVVGTYVFSIRMFPALIYLSQKKNLMDEPGERSSHTLKTPTLGGVGIFISFSLVLILFGIFADFIREDLIKLLTIIGASILLLFLGLKDDLLVISPRKKFIGQLVPSLLVILATDVRIVSMEGIFGLSTLPYIVSVIFTLFVFILVINAYNLIDGIDGLAGCIAVLISAFLGGYFVFNNEMFMGLMAFVLIGAQCGFLEHNLAKTQKLFMGDSGSLFTGFLLAYQVVEFLNFNTLAAVSLKMDNTPILALAILSFPLFDTLRVFAVRIRNGKSPFRPDCNHIHHRFLQLGFSHKRATMTIVATNVFVIVLALVLQNLNIHLALVLCLAIGVAAYLLPFSDIFEKWPMPDTAHHGPRLTTEEEEETPMELQMDVRKRKALKADTTTALQRKRANLLKASQSGKAAEMNLNEQGEVHWHKESEKIQKMKNPDIKNR